MKHRTARSLTAITIGAALALAGCSSDEEASPSPSESSSEVAEPTEEDIAAVEAITLTGEPGTEPTIELEPPVSVSAQVVRVVTEGTGAELDGTAWVRWTSVLGSTGESAGSSWDAQPQELAYSGAMPGDTLAEALATQKVGAQLLLAAPGPEEGETLVTALEIVEPLPPMTVGEGMPTVTFDDAGVPSIALQPTFRGPDELIVQVLTEGTGPVVESGQNATFNYSGWAVSTGEKFDSSYDKGEPFTTAIGTGAVIPGWDQGIVGQPVGTKLLLVIPKELAYGGSANPLANEDLAFVVEILAAE